MRWADGRGAILLIAIIVVAGCASPAGAPPDPGAESGQQTVAGKPLHMARQNEPTALAELVRFVAEDLPSLPWYYPMEAYAVRAGLQGVSPTKPGDGWTTANAHQLYWRR